MNASTYRASCIQTAARRSASFALHHGRTLGRSARWSRQYQDFADRAEADARRAFAALLGMEG